MKSKTKKILWTRLAIVFIAALPLIFLPSTSAQRRQQTQQRSTAKVYNRFDHTVAAHRKQSCNSCHKSPTGSSRGETANGEKYSYPDITDYPDHESCYDCHRQQIFRGARPAFCTICHTKVSPRDKARFDFPRANQPAEFAIRFPHDVHQDIIAERENSLPSENGTTAAMHFVKANFNPAVSFADDKKTGYNNCTICHAPAGGRTYSTIPRKPLDEKIEFGLTAVSHAEKLTAKAGYFKESPENHSSCFNCHYSEQKPTHTDCAGCHILTSRPISESGSIPRISLKFNHEQLTESGSNPHDKECVSCHVRITQSADIRKLTPDVPVFACASKGNGCHSDEVKTEVDRRVEDVLKKQTDSKYQIQKCSYCHTSFIGSYQIPESHKVIKP